ncbi:MAG: hypothetical protein KAU90_11860 [Sulfurovaceae bacterium]|nr:hypothetical protein [Sulfurovaceae bacterium]
MTTQFILSLIGLVIAGGGLGLGALYTLYRWKKKTPFTFNAIIAIYISTLVLLGIFSGYKFLTSSYHITKKGVGYVVDKGQDLVSSTISFGMVTIFDSFGKTTEHYEQKWENQKINKSNRMKFSIISIKEKKDGDKPTLHITFSSKNDSNKIVSLNQMVKDELILLKDKKGLCFPLTLSDNREITIAPHSSLVSEVDVIVPDGVSIKEFVTPNQVISLGRL